MILPLPETPETELRLLSSGHGWLAVDKPTGISVHNDPEGRADAIHLAAEMLAADADLRARTGWTPGQLPSPVHRLDRETSGILLLAVDSKVASVLQSAFQQKSESQNSNTPQSGSDASGRLAQKTYVAVVRGQVTSEKRTWSWPLSDRAEGRDRPQGPSHLRKSSLTEFRIDRANRHLTRIVCELHTGRQHQIRRHAALAKHAIVGDKRYGESRFNRKIEDLYGIHRMFLHAMTLELEVGGKIGAIRLHCPPPPEFDLVFEELVT